MIPTSLHRLFKFKKISGRKETFANLNFLAKQQYCSRRLVLIRRNFVLDVTGPVGVLEGVQRLHEVTVGR